MIDFVKGQGTGNDLVVFADLENRLEISADAVRRLCDRHFGVGADGVIVITSGRQAPYFMDYRNADGSVAEMCGNGVRVVAKYLGDRRIVEGDFSLETRSGVKDLRLGYNNVGLVENVAVDMGPPVGDIVDVNVDVGDAVFKATLVSMGNPHAVVFVDDIDVTPVDDFGARIGRHPMFANGTNVEFVDERGGILRQRTWERGVGETLACGTGACAVVVAATVARKVDRYSAIDLRGGRLHLEWRSNGSVVMSGPAVESFAGRLDPAAYGVTVRS